MMKKQPVCIIDFFGNKRWLLSNGECHREDGPAYEHTNGFKQWIQHNQYHREDGPACIWPNGEQNWYWNGEYVPVKSQDEFERWLRLRAFA
jgi:hypothetical protein